MEVTYILINNICLFIIFFGIQKCILDICYRRGKNRL
nr:MAG TPA: hypothetical protein [Caudoviricetes sp.]